MMKRVKKNAREPGTSIEPQNSQFAPRPFTQRPPAAQEPKHEVHEAPSLESVERAKRFGHNFADISIFPPQETVQPKLRLGPVNDRYEQEADQVARRVVETISSSDQESVQRRVKRESENFPVKVELDWNNIKIEGESGDTSYSQTAHPAASSGACSRRSSAI